MTAERMGGRVGERVEERVEEVGGGASGSEVCIHSY